MALTQCRECGREVPIQAGACPHCGAPEQAGGRAPAVAASPTGASAFRRPPPPPTPGGATPHQSRDSDEAPAQARVTKAAQEAAFRRRLIWGLAGVAIVLFALGLSRTLGSWVVLSPLALLCVVAVGLGLHTALRGRSLPFFPNTRRAHGVLLTLVAVTAWVVASAFVPRTLEEKQQEARNETARQEAARKRVATEGPYTVTYRVLTSRCCITSATMEGPSGTTQDTNPGMYRDKDARAFVYSRTFTLPAGGFAYISAQATEYAEWTRCQIEVNGEVKLENESRGGFSIVTCSGRL